MQAQPSTHTVPGYLCSMPSIILQRDRAVILSLTGCLQTRRGLMVRYSLVPDPTPCPRSCSLRNVKSEPVNWRNVARAIQDACTEEATRDRKHTNLFYVEL